MKPPLKERLKWDPADVSLTATTWDPVLMARYGTYLFGAGGTLGLILLAMPHPSTPNEVGVLVSALGAYVGAGIMLIGWDRIPHWAFQALIAVGTVVISFGLFFNNQTTGAIVVLYVSVAISAFYFFSWRQATLQVILIGVCYGVVLLVGAARQPFPAAVQAWVVTIGMILIVGVLMGQVRQRVDWLVKRLTDAARTDELTQLLNRRGFQELFDHELERSRRSKQGLSLVIGDLDRFKDINDRFGHGAGDDALKRLSAVLMGGKRKIDVAARMGGEEFALILPNTDEHGAYMVAERLRSGVLEAFEGEPLPLTISFGIASSPTHGETAEELLHSADQALYAAKALGRNRSVIHSPEIAGTMATALPREPEKEGHLATVLALAETLDVRDQGTAKHSHTVGRYAEQTARELGLPSEMVERVRLAGILHDVGKVGIPDSVLKKPGPLDEEEWVMMRKHPEIAARILEGSDIDDIRKWVLAHQERPDGRGYPEGLKADEIPLEAKILAVADAWEAMTSDRVYRPALSPEAARTELLQCAGSQFDPRVVDAFLRLFEQPGVRSRSAA